jgi:hypothetical protein
MGFGGLDERHRQYLAGVPTNGPNLAFGFSVLSGNSHRRSIPHRPLAISARPEKTRNKLSRLVGEFLNTNANPTSSWWLPTKAK